MSDVKCVRPIVNRPTAEQTIAEIRRAHEFPNTTGQRLAEFIMECERLQKIVDEPDVSLRAWINAEGIRAEVVHFHTGYGYDRAFERTYDKSGQVAAIWESFRQELLEFIDDFRKKR